MISARDLGFLMSEVELTDRIDQAVEAILRGASVEVADSSEADFTGIAAELHLLPREGFRASLKQELEEDARKHKQPKKVASAAVRKGFRTVTPYLVVADVHQEIDFIKKVFRAKGKLYGGLGSEGGFHSEYRIGDSLLMIGGGGQGSKWKGTPAPMTFHLYVQNIDDVYGRAMEAGATSLVPPTDMVYGERSAAIEDAAGNHWYLATAFGERYAPEGLPNLMPVFHPRGARRMINFLESAFAAQPLAVHQTGKGVVKHAQLRIGESILEIGEAHGRWQPRPMHFMLNVADCDTAYYQAMKAEGGKSIRPPADAPYGGRTAAIEDPFGNTWYLSSPTKARGKKKPKP